MIDSSLKQLLSPNSLSTDIMIDGKIYDFFNNTWKLGSAKLNLFFAAKPTDSGFQYKNHCISLFTHNCETLG